MLLTYIKLLIKNVKREVFYFAYCNILIYIGFRATHLHAYLCVIFVYLFHLQYTRSFSSML